MATLMVKTKMLKTQDVHPRVDGQGVLDDQPALKYFIIPSHLVVSKNHKFLLTELFG
jgi:hypothetical protein